MLELDGVEAGYGSAQVLFGVSFSVNAGACVSLMGRNGMGKTTTVRAIMGQLPLQGGRITRFGMDDSGRDPFELARAGIGLVPEGRQIFTNLSVRENLATFSGQRAMATRSGQWTACSICSHGCANGWGAAQPVRRRTADAGYRPCADDQSAAAGAGRGDEGLAPIIRRYGTSCDAETCRTVDSGDRQEYHRPCAACRSSLHLEKGRVVWQGDSAALTADPDLTSRYLGV